MGRQDGVGRCEHCGHSFGYMLVHNGFNDSAYCYCDACGCTAILNGWERPVGVTFKLHEPIAPSAEPLLQLCACGGRFTGNASPRCPNCKNPLSAHAAASWIEAQAPGAKQGWQWQDSWRGLYCIVIEDRAVYDNWRTDSNAG